MLFTIVVVLHLITDRFFVHKVFKPNFISVFYCSINNTTMHFVCINHLITRQELNFVSNINFSLVQT